MCVMGESTSERILLHTWSVSFGFHLHTSPKGAITAATYSYISLVPLAKETLARLFCRTIVPCDSQGHAYCSVRADFKEISKTKSRACMIVSLCGSHNVLHCRRYTRRSLRWYHRGPARLPRHAHSSLPPHPRRRANSGNQTGFHHSIPTAFQGHCCENQSSRCQSLVAVLTLASYARLGCQLHCRPASSPHSSIVRITNANC